MEQQKVLIIIISAALFVAAVLGVGLALFYPDSAGTATAEAREFDPIEYAREPEEPQEEESVFLYGGEEEEETEERVIVLTEEPAEVKEPGEEPSETGAEDEPEVTGRPARETAVPEEPEPPVATPQPEPAPPRRPEPREPSTATAGYERAPDPEPRRIRVTEHWIQLISSPNKERVDLVRERLREEFSLGARVTTTEVNGATYYRIRLGPYDDRAEAEKFLSWIREVEGFGEAYISEEYPLRTVR
jgi:cell division protein FtsN